METFSCLINGAGRASEKEKSILNVENDKLAFCSRGRRGRKKVKIAVAKGSGLIKIDS